MTFDPNQQEKKTILERLRAAPARFQVSRSVLTSFAVLLAIGLWIGSGVFNGDANTVEPAQAIKTRSLEETPFRVIAREISASDTTAIVRLQGRTEADRIVTLASETSGTIVSLPTPKGRRVQKGQLICEIDAGARAAMLAEAKAKRDAARINYEASQRLLKKAIFPKANVPQAKPILTPPLLPSKCIRSNCRARA